MGKPDKRLIQAVAGSGKTTYIIEQLEENSENVAIITYTDVNQEVLKEKIREKFKGRIPENIHVFGLFQFIYSFCLTPYLNERPRGINFDSLTTNAGNQKKYMDSNDRFYKDRLSKALLDYAHKIPYILRIDRYFSKIFVDEVQDLGGDDLSWLFSLKKCKAEILCVGDFYQGTFSTSSRGNTNKAVKTNFDKYKKKFAKNGFIVDEETLQESQRCTNETCCFIREKLGINIKSAKSEHSTPPMLITDKSEILRIWNDDDIPKLFYWKHKEYLCGNSMNWGESKGLTRNNVCVILTDTLSKTFKKGSWEKMALKTKAGFYVACTRASGQVYFIEQKSIANFKRS
ncbi:MAG: AAA family ATPase [Lactococcus lactis]|nr:AAA family ATPase [Lactococcus lactis]